MNKYKQLVKNFGLLTISNFATKVLSFFLLPLYTSILTTEEYGIFDYIWSIVMVLVPIFTLNIQESVLRFATDEKYEKNQVCSFGVLILLVSFCTISMLTYINHFILHISMIDRYPIYFLLFYIGYSTNQYLTSFVRAIDRVKDIALSSVLSSLVLIFTNIIFLKYIGLGIEGYFIATILSYLSSITFLLVQSRTLSYLRWKSSKDLQKEMIRYCLPLIINSIGWWVTNLSDRYFVTKFSGIDQNGIYGVAYKIPQIIALVSGVFTQVWPLSAIKESGNSNSKKFFLSVYNIYNIVLILICYIVIVSIRFIARYLFANGFYSAWIYVPFLCISSALVAICGYFGGIYSALMYSKYSGYSTGFAAFVNIILNYFLISSFGPMGAATATLISYFVLYIIRICSIKKIAGFSIPFFKDLISYVLLTLLGVMLIYISGIKLFMFEVIIFALIILLYRSNIVQIINRVKTLVKNRSPAV